MRPEAAIVNYYPAGASMGGHLDDAEINMEQPIVSIDVPPMVVLWFYAAVRHGKCSNCIYVCVCDVRSR